MTAESHELVDERCSCGAVPDGSYAMQHPPVLWHYIHTLPPVEGVAR